MPWDRNPWLIVGGSLSALAALLHLGVIVGGPRWYRFMGAGEGMAQAAARGEWRPALLTLGIAAILAIWAAYAFAGAGLIGRLPLMLIALVGISAVYLLRGLVILKPSALGRPDPFRRIPAVVVGDRARDRADTCDRHLAGMERLVIGDLR